MYSSPYIQITHREVNAQLDNELEKRTDLERYRGRLSHHKILLIFY